MGPPAGIVMPRVTPEEGTTILDQLVPGGVSCWVSSAA